MAHSQDYRIIHACLDRLGRGFGGQRQGLFTKHVFAGTGGSYYLVPMCRMGCCEEDGFNLAECQNVIKAFINRTAELRPKFSTLFCG